MTAHHLIADAWTMSLVLEEIHQNYVDIVAGKTIDLTPNLSYSIFIDSQKKYMNSSKYENDKDFWHKTFKTLPNIISFKNNTKVSIYADRKIYAFDKSLVNKINEFCDKNLMFT